MVLVLRVEPPPSGDVRSMMPPSAPAAPAAPMLEPVAVNVVPGAPATSGSGAVVGIGLAIAGGAFVLASAIFPLAARSLETAADGATLSSDAGAMLVFSFLLIAGSLALFLLARRELAQALGWTVVALAGGAGVGVLDSQLLRAGASAIATAPLYLGRTSTSLPYTPAVALVTVTGVVGGAIVTATRGWSVRAASAWLGCAMLAAFGVSLALFSVWLMGSASQLQAEAQARYRGVPGVGAALVIAAVVVLALARRGRS